MFELNKASNIRNIDITETLSGAKICLTLGDAPNEDSFDESLSFSVQVDFDKNLLLTLEKMKEGALLRVQALIDNEIRLSQGIQRNYM